MHPLAAVGTVPDVSLAEPGVLAFVALPLLLAALAVAGVAAAAHRLGERAGPASRAIAATGVLAAAWLAGSWYAARSGALGRADGGEQALLFGAVLVLALGLAFTGYGRRLSTGLPLAALVVLQSFRWPLAHAMDAMAARGIAPATGALAYGLEAAVGVTALAAAALAGSPRARGLLAAWNLAGIGALAATAVLALAGTPSIRFAGGAHGGAWVAHAPFVWLPAALVAVALAGHVLVFRALRAAAAAERSVVVPAHRASEASARIDRSAA